MNSASAKIHFGDGAVSYKDLRVARSEGSGSGDFTYDFARHEVRIENLKTTLWPNEIVYWIDPTLLKVVDALQIPTTARPGHARGLSVRWR